MLLLTAGCAPLAEIPLPTGDQLAQLVSDVAFRRQYTCEELAHLYGVAYLPVVETPDELGLDYEEHWLPTAGGDVLRLWYLPTSLDRGTVVLSQGSVGVLPCYLFHARMLADNGWSVVMYEYRGFGLSTGQADVSTLSGDLSTVLDWTLARTGREHVTLMGISIGTIPSMAVAVERPGQVNGLVLDSPVALGAMIEPLEPILGDMTRELIDRLAPELVLETLVPQLGQPLLILVGGDDTLTTPAAAQRLYDLAPGQRRLVVFPGADHVREAFRDTGAYTYNVERFLSSVWSQYVPFELQTGSAASD